MPFDCLPQASLKSFGGFPSKLPLDFGGIDDVAAVVARAVFDESDLFLVGRAISPRRQTVERITYRVHNFKVWLLVPTADVIGLAYFTFGKNSANGRAVVFYVEPVADLLSIAVDGKQFSG